MSSHHSSPPTEDTWDDEDSVHKSKTQIKKEMNELQALGVAISQLTAEQQARIPLHEELRKVIEQAPRIKGRGAIRRHHQFIGKLMRKDDSDAIKQAYEEVIAESHRTAQQHHLIERWRDRLLSDESGVLEQFIEQHPQCDRQQLRQLVRSTHKEKSANKPPASARKLFKLIRETLAEK